MKTLVLILAITCFTSTATKTTQTVDIKSFCEGWLTAVFKQDMAAKASECLDYNNLEGYINNAIRDFQEKTLEGIMNGVIELYNFWVVIPKAVDTCLSDQSDVIAVMKDKASAIMELVHNSGFLWKSVLKNGLKNGYCIFEDVEKGIKAAEVSNWFQAGKYFGDAVDLAIFGAQIYKTDIDNAEKFIEGFLIGVFQEDVAGDLTKCLQIDVIQQHLETAIADFKQFTLDGITQGMKEIFQVLEMIPTAIDKCLVDSEMASKMKAKLSEFEDLMKNPEIVSIIQKNFISNAFTVIKDFTESLAYFKSGDFQRAGQEVGEAINYLMFGGKFGLRESLVQSKLQVLGSIQ